MSHLKTGNAFYGVGSYKAYKFLGQELQETGFYDMNARFYMADLGRFGQHDPLSANTLDPYGYGYNNPIFFADPTGLEGEPVPGGSGPGGPQAIGTASSPIDVGEIVLNPPIRAIANNAGSILPNNCTLCYSGNGSSSGIKLSAPQIQPLPANWNCGHCNDGPIRYIGGAGDPLGILEAAGMAYSAYSGGKVNLLLAAILITRSGNTGLKALAAEKGILEVEGSIAKINSRHYLNSSSIASGKTRAGTFGPQNILQEDIAAYNAGNFSKIGNDVSINSRIYGVKNEGATLFPRSGGAPEFMDLTQGQIKAIQLMKKVPANKLNQALEGAKISSSDVNFAKEFITKY